MKFPKLNFDIETTKENNVATGLKVLVIAWRVRKSGVIAYFFAAFAEIAASILTIYASAQLANLLLHATLQVNQPMRFGLALSG